MFLTKVELSGFKSFPDRTVFEFDKGITAILGPNGCGKSNVVDAIKWVLGESRPKQLRGDQMLDVIFAGSEKRKPVGMAEVNLYFDNSDNSLPVDYREVCVTRRLYRSGESEYLINRQPCRRRDIRELFMDTGVGTSAYSFIEQGRVEALLHAKPEERRAVFEEAAGISKYKARRKETLARLERTQQYLDRVNDIVEEVEKNIRRVARQAAGARRYQRLKAELDLLRTHAYTRRHRELSARIEELGRQRAEIDALFAQEGSRQAELSSRIAELTAQETELSERIGNQEREANQLQDGLTRAQVELSAATERLSSLAREEQEAATRAVSLRVRIAEIETSETETGTLLQEKRAEAGTLAEEFRTREAERQHLQGEADAAERAIAELRRAIAELSEKRNRLGQDLVRAESEQESVSQRLEALAERAATAAAREAETLAALGGLEIELAGVAGQIARANEETSELKRGEAALRTECEEYASRLSQLRSDLSARASRLSTLQDLDSSLAGAFAGVRAVMLAHKEGNAGTPSVRGLVADLISVPGELALAVETALGGQAQDIVVETARDAQCCIEYLKRNRAGRATFLPLDQIRPRQRLTRECAGLSGVRGEAVDLVEFAPEYRAVMEYLLAGVLVVETLDRARELARSEGRGVRMVTLDGEVINAHGAMTGGQGQKQQTGLVMRKAEMQELEAEIAKLQGRTADVEAGRNQSLAALLAAGESIKAKEKEILALVPRGQELQRDVSVRKNEAGRLRAEGGELQAEREKLTGTLSGLAPRREELTRDAAEVAAAETRAANELEERLSKSAGGRGELAALSEALAGLRERRASTETQIAELERRLQSFAADKAERGRELENREGFSARAATERKAIRARLEELQQQEAELVKRRDAFRGEGTELRGQLGSLRTRLNEERESERAAQKRLGQIMEAQNGLKLQESETRLKLDAVAEKARQELEIADLAAAAAKLAETQAVLPLEFGDDEDEPGRARGEARASLASGTPLPEMTDEQLSTLIQDTAVKIERIGPVNLLAIEEQAELEARVEFLRGEQDDLQQAATDLLGVIERLNQECNRRFDETFAAVRTNFQELFRKLFGGGKADLVLEAAEGAEGIDKIDAGIDIIARPPGKEPKSISLLSGGEKALCAVALLFAIFRSKPSPFCILDEVDGPLDESNIDRFMNAVREFSEDTQFILISHSKRTMGMTDTIYGVTQDEPGVSTKYSLRFTEMYDAEVKKGKEEEDLVAVG